VHDFVTAEEVLEAVAVDWVVLGLRPDLPAKKKAQLPEVRRRFFLSCAPAAVGFGFLAAPHPGRGGSWAIGSSIGGGGE